MEDFLNRQHFGERATGGWLAWLQQQLHRHSVLIVLRNAHRNCSGDVGTYRRYQLSNSLTDDEDTSEDEGILSPALQNANAIKDYRQALICPHAKCRGKQRTSYAKTGNLLRHYNGRMTLRECRAE